MYEDYFGLRERAFDLSLNPRYFILMPMHREALANIQYAVHTKQGITILIGEPGTGKTLVLRRALGGDVGTGSPLTWIGTGGPPTWISINNPALTRDEFFECLTERFGLGHEAAGSKTRFLRLFEEALREQRAQGRAIVLVIDEAQSISDDLLEEIRLLANIEGDTGKLLSVVLAGQPELGRRLNQPHLQQLKQRVALRCVLESLSAQGTATYIAGRVRVAGGDPAALFSREAVIAVHEHSCGIPRTISVICESALLLAFAAARPRVGSDIVVEVARDLDFAVGQQRLTVSTDDTSASGHSFRSPEAETGIASRVSTAGAVHADPVGRRVWRQ
jgi:type II secretory pathway predicted ATPase ExeA